MVLLYRLDCHLSQEGEEELTRVVDCLELARVVGCLE